MRRSHRGVTQEAIIGGGRRTGGGRATASGRLLAEAVRYDEIANGPPPAADKAPNLTNARDAPGSVEAKIIVRAGGLPTAPQLEQELAHLRTVLRALGVAGAVIAAAGGAATARTALTSADGTTVNFFWLLASLLGLHLLSFVAWLVLMLAAPGHTRGGALGSAVIWLWRQAAVRFGAGRHRIAAAQALGARWGRGRAASWLASGLSHGLWFGYLLGALLMTLALLSAQRYTFVWETTILDATVYTRLTNTLAAIPAAVGVAVPDRAAVLAAEWPGSVDTGHEVLWSSLLIAAIFLYGLLPRALALAVSTLLARRGVATTPLDLTQPYYAELVARLAPVTRRTRVLDRGDDGHAHLAAVTDLDHLPPPASSGQICLLGWEIDAPAAGWPPPGTPAHVRELGRRDGRDDLTRVIGLLKETNTTLARLAVVLDLRQTPDRGVTAALVALRAAASGRLVLLFTGASALHQRVGATEAAIRQADWVQAGKAANIDATHMVAIDLDEPTDADRLRLAQLLGVAP